MPPCPRNVTFYLFVLRTLAAQAKAVAVFKTAVHAGHFRLSVHTSPDASALLASCVSCCALQHITDANPDASARPLLCVSCCALQHIADALPSACVLRGATHMVVLLQHPSVHAAANFGASFPNVASMCAAAAGSQASDVDVILSCRRPGGVGHARPHGGRRGGVPPAVAAGAARPARRRGAFSSVGEVGHDINDLSYPIYSMS